MNAVELIVAKREGRELAPSEIEWLIREYVAGALPDYQISAFLMAVFFRGMTPAETAAYTRAMLHSGETYDLSSIPGVKTDKHSTGGVGDKVSLVLAPLAAAAGIPVPMMSGRGLGHSGGTLDKLESIKGFRTMLGREEALRQLERIGVIMIGQSERIAPADRKLYALRDVTGTVESIPLICGSILSKKVASGVQALVMDVKTGSGAFMRTLEDSRALARQLTAIGTALGMRMVSYITDMDQPLGFEAGNACEMIETIECLRGGGPADLREITLVLTAEMIELAGRAANAAEARSLAERLLDGGQALEKFKVIIEAQGGDPRVADRPEMLELAPDAVEVKAPRDGFISGFDARAIGLACNALGAGRASMTDKVDTGVGIRTLAKRNDAVRAGQTLAILRHRAGRGLPYALDAVQGAIHISEAAPQPRPLIFERIPG